VRETYVLASFDREVKRLPSPIDQARVDATHNPAAKQSPAAAAAASFRFPILGDKSRS
jgi:hypothetical protein